MKEFMYDIDTLWIVSILFISMMAVIEGTYLLGKRVEHKATKEVKSHVNAIQGSLLGILALLLGFTFSLALQRYDSRSASVVEEASAMSTVYAQSHLVPKAVRQPIQDLLVTYVDTRIEASTNTLTYEKAHHELSVKANSILTDIWRYTRQAAEIEPNPVTTGLFIQALNDVSDAHSKREAALRRHVPEIVLILLYITFLMSGTVIGYASGLEAHRPSFPVYIMVLLISILVFVIVDLDRPRRGLIIINQTPLVEVQQSIHQEYQLDKRSP